MLIFKDVSTTYPDNMVESWPIHSSSITSIMTPSKKQLETQEVSKKDRRQETQEGKKGPTSSILFPLATHQCARPTLTIQVARLFSDMLILASKLLLMYFNFDLPNSNQLSKDKKPSPIIFALHHVYP